MSQNRADSPISQVSHVPHRVSLNNLSLQALSELVEELGQPAYRVRQIQEWLEVKGAQTFDDMTNIPKQLRESLSERAYLEGFTAAHVQTSQDGSKKYLLKAHDGALVECVGMPTGKRLTVCISSQVGCGMKCSFCATGQLGLTRNLSWAEMYNQVLFVQRDFGQRVTNIVVMGQGEPFANYQELMKALRAFNDPARLHLGARHITVSTCGFIGEILKFAKEKEQFELAISLHSAIQKTRNMLMPGVKKFPLNYLYEIIQQYTALCGREITLEYALIGGVNDTQNELDALCEFCTGNLVHVNLIQLNKVEGSPFKPSTQAKADEFIRRLNRVGVSATLRKSRGQDIDAACGQLMRKRS